MRVSAYCSHRHYADHLLPVLAGLPEPMRGGLYCATDELAQELRLRGDRGWILGPREARLSPMPPGEPVLVAGFRDVRLVRGRPVALIEHGAGQRYEGVRDGSYAGGRGRDRVSLFLCPNEDVANVNRQAYPQARSVTVGSPRLDVLWKARTEYRQHRDGSRVAVSFHWPCGLVPEAGSGWDAFRVDVTGLAARGDWQILGHGHPRHWSRMSKWWAKIGVERVAEWLSVVRRADVYVCDNSSTMFEACALGLPVVVLNPPEYRRHVEHGLRFWRHAAMGPQVSPGESLSAAVRLAPAFVEGRREAAQAAYAVLPDGSGEATARAVEAVLSWASA
jgi:hypothetical protein